MTDPNISKQNVFDYMRDYANKVIPTNNLECFKNNVLLSSVRNHSSLIRLIAVPVTAL